MRDRLLIAVVLTSCGWGSRARADAWVPVVVEHPQAERTVATVRQVIAALNTEQGLSVLDPGSAARKFESLHSGEPVDMPSEELQRLGTAVSKAIEEGALGDWEAADEQVRAFRELSETDQDHVKFRLMLADDVLLYCLKSVHAKLAAGRQDAARAEMGRCIFASPKQRPRPNEHESAVLELYDSVRTELLGNDLSTLSVDVDTPSTEGCSVVISGNPARPVPYKEAGLLPTAMRVQVSCQEPGRIHRLKLKPGDNALIIDRRFDRTVHTKGVLSLRYRDADEEQAWQLPDAAHIGQLLGESTLLLMRRQDERVSLLRVDDGAATANVTLRLDASDAEVRQAAHSLANASSAEVSPAVAETVPTRHIDAPASTGTELVVGATLAALGVGAAVAGWVYLDARRDALDAFDAGHGLANFTRYEDLGTLTIVTATGAAALGSLAMVSLLPPEQGVPAWSWVVGGIGVGVAATGIALWSGGSACADVGCDPEQTDPRLGQVIALHGVPLLAVPLTHGIRALVGDKQLTAFARHDGGTSTLSVRTRF